MKARSTWAARRSSVCIAAASVLFCAAGTAQLKPSNPTLMSYTPTQGAAGSTITITLNGTNFVSRAMKLIFTPSQGITVSNLQVLSPMQMSAQVQIDPSAQTGNRQLILIDADRNLPSRVPFMVTAASASPSCPPGITAAGCGAKAPPALRGFAPLQGTQGSSVTVTFTGANFVSPASLQLAPASGITVSATTVVNANEIQAHLTIAPNAPLGARGVVLSMGNSKLPAPNTFTVVSGLISHMPPIQILRVVPNQIAAGAQNVDVTLQGVNFVPGTQVNFTVGAGVPAAVFAAGPARYVNSTELHVTVSALSSALPGGRDITLATPSQQTVTGKGMLNVLAAKQSGAPKVLKIPPIALQNFPQGVIKLDGPLGGSNCVPDSGCSYGIPLLDDDAVFKWHEQNPGLADYYELRIYGKDGKTLLYTKKITGGTVQVFGGTLKLIPTYYRPDAAFLAAVLAPRLLPIKIAPAPSSSSSGSLKSISAGSSFLITKLGTSPPPGSAANPTGPSTQLANADMQFEVAGFHTYNKNGVAPQQNQTLQKQNSGITSQSGAQVNSAANQPSSQNVQQNQTVDIQVEISDRWPLNAPAAPTGLACNGTGFGSGLNVNDLDRQVVNGKPDPNDYTLDRFQLTGTFNLTRSPFATHPTLHQAPGSQCQGCLFGTIDQVQFDDLFVDWGDGEVDRLDAQPANSNMTNWDRSQQLELASSCHEKWCQHKYQYPGSYTVRVFQLSEADAQHVNVNLVAASVDGPSTPFLQATVLTNIASSASLKNAGLTQSTVQSGFQSVLGQHGSSSGGTQGPNPSQVASDAYMIFCHPVNITVREDLDADGPLHLKSIADPDFPGYDIGKSPGSSVLKGISLNQPITGKPAPQSSTPAQGERPLKLQPLHPGEPQPSAICSACDDGLTAASYLGYYGTGEVRVTWTVDGVQSQQTFSLPPSQKRNNLPPPGSGLPVPPIIVSNSKPFYSSQLTVQPIGMHSVQVEADVVPDPTIPNLAIAVGHALGAISLHGTSSTNTPSGAASAQSPANEAQSLLNTLSPPAGSSLPPLKIGILSPSNQNSGGSGAVQYINSPLHLIANLPKLAPDQHVASNAKQYQVVASDPTKPCKFHFPVKSGGYFEISGLQNHVTKQGTKYSGTGNLIVHLANSSSGGYDEYPPIPVNINGWDVPDGQTVQTGSISVSPKLTLAATVPGLQGTLDQLQGQAGGELDATLSVSLSDGTLRLPGVETPQTWSGVTAELHSNGDWMKDGLNLPKTLIGWSAFTMQSSSVRLDLSHHDGDAANYQYCGPLKGGDWVGVRFPSLAVTPYTMDLVSGSSLQPVVSDWGINDNGLCGSLSTGPFSAKLGQGTVSFQSINAQAYNRTFTAQYNGIDIHVPWLDTDLKGNATLQSGGGQQAGISFPLTAPAVSKTYGNIKFTASNLQFTSEQNLGWVVQANTHFVFSAENNQLAAFDRVFYFGMDGRGYFANANQTADIPLGGSSKLGQTPLNLVSAHLTAPPSGNQVLGIQINTNVHLSEVMSAANVQVNYEIDNSGTNYSSKGPTNSPFTIDVPYPSGQPSSEGKIHPVYSGGSGGTEYSGTVDLSELGGPPITGEFRLGYQGGHDYWLTRVTYTLSPDGVVLIPAPPVMNLYRVQGGLGHNFPISAFENTGSINAAQPVMDNSFLFMAGMRVGMPDKFTYTLDGDLVIKSSGQDAGARLDFHAWLLKQADSSNGDFQGLFQFAGGNFDGKLWGRLNFMNGAAYLDLGNSVNNAAIDMHFGPSGPWHLDAGKKEGPRIRGHLLVADADMYFMLSDAGLSLGGGANINMDVGDDSVASAYIRAGMDMGLTITPQPHIEGDFSAYADAGVCVDSVCVSAGVNAQVHAAFAPLDVRATASIGLPWPLGSISFTVHV